MVHDFAHLIWYINRFSERMRKKKEKRKDVGFQAFYSTPIVILCSKQVMYVMLLLWSTSKWKGDLDILGTITKQQLKPLATYIRM